MKIGVIILARANFGRWPDKILYPLCGKPMFEWVIEKSKKLDVDEVIVSTTEFPEDDIIIKTTLKHDCRVSLGHPNNRRERILKAAARYELDYVIPMSPAVPFFDLRYQNKIINYLIDNPGSSWYRLGDSTHNSATFPIIKTKSIKSGFLAIYEDPDLYFDPVNLPAMKVFHWRSKYVANRYLYDLNIAYPFQAEIARRICDKIGHFPETYEEIQNVLMEIRL